MVGRLPALTTALVLSVAAGALPLIEFYHGAIYLPGRANAALTQTISVTHEGTLNGMNFAVVKYEVSNDTDTAMLVLASAVYVCAYPNGTRIGEPVAEGQDRRCATALDQNINQGSWIAAKSSLSMSRAIETPQNRPVVTVRTKLAFALGDRLRLAHDPPEALPAPGCAVTDRRIVEASRYESLVQKNKYVVYQNRPDGYTVGIVPAGRHTTCPADGEEYWLAITGRLPRSYGLVERTAVWEGRPALTAKPATTP
ncbi:hypothetical protein [Paractinoplanes lichenicola]|uniref:Uncharacterized protein n=1 Tax=Paractinoplanes lichenicola TaxID=2802976 RepID=A0ABS1VMQ2_9ACTN|nr:hypothetical protein [Actinoplanes lichenicola]MBL7255933.1 hypothetical protein [Actinoplanes lichenicola]